MREKTNFPTFPRFLHIHHTRARAPASYLFLRKVRKYRKRDGFQPFLLSNPPRKPWKPAWKGRKWRIL